MPVFFGSNRTQIALFLFGLLWFIWRTFTCTTLTGMALTALANSFVEINHGPNKEQAYCNILPIEITQNYAFSFFLAATKVIPNINNKPPYKANEEAYAIFSPVAITVGSNLNSIWCLPEGTFKARKT